jgi:hypothetical protein
VFLSTNISTRDAFLSLWPYAMLLPVSIRSATAFDPFVKRFRFAYLGNSGQNF